jgi:hypothetical protein
MNTQEILTIIAMAALGLCLVLAFSKGMTKNLKTKESMTHACSFLVLIAVALLAVTQFLSEKENMDWEIGSVATASIPNGGRAKKGGGKASMGLGNVPVCCLSCNPDASSQCGYVSKTGIKGKGSCESPVPCPDQPDWNKYRASDGGDGKGCYNC